MASGYIGRNGVWDLCALISANVTSLAVFTTNTRNGIGEPYTDLGFGMPTNSEYNAILCATCMKLFEDEDMWYVPDSKEIFCEECFDEFLNYNTHPKTKIQDQCDIDNDELLLLMNKKR